MQVSGEELPAEGAGCEGLVCSESGERVTVAEGRESVDPGQTLQDLGGSPQYAGF